VESSIQNLKYLKIIYLLIHPKSIFTLPAVGQERAIIITKIKARHYQIIMIVVPFGQVTSI